MDVYLLFLLNLTGLFVTTGRAETLKGLISCMDCLSNHHEQKIQQKSTTNRSMEERVLLSHDFHMEVGNEENNTSFIVDHICFIKAFQVLLLRSMIIICDEVFHKHIVEANCNFSPAISIRTIRNHSTHKDIQKMFLDIISEETYSAFQLLGPPEIVSVIFDVSKNIGLSGSNYTWILPFNALVFVEISNQPSRFILLQTNRPSFGLYPRSTIEKTFCEGYCRGNIFNSNHNLFTIRTRIEPGKLVKVGSVVNFHPQQHQDFYKLESNQLLSRLFSTSYFNVGGGARVRLKVVTILDPPFIIVKSESINNMCDVGHLCWVYQTKTTSSEGSNRFHQGEEGFEEEIPLVGKCCVGFCIDLLELLNYDLNIEVDLYIVKDSVYGDKVNNTWVGMVGDVVNGKADLIIAALTMNEQRTEVIDYAGPYMVGGVGIVTMIEKSMLPFINLEAFKPLTGEMWFVTLMIMFTSCVMFVVTERIVESKTIKNGREQHRTCSYTFRQSFFYIGGLAFQRDIGGEQPIHLGSRFIAIVIAASLLVIMTTYTAVLTANKVTHKTKLPIIGFKDSKITNPTSSFVYGTIANSAFTRMFRESSDPNWNRMYHFMKDYNFRDTNQAIEDLKTGKLNAIIHDYPVLLHFISKDLECRINLAGEPIKDAGYGLGVKKGNPLRDKLSELIISYQDRGHFTVLKKRWMNTKCEAGTSAGVSQLGINFFGGLFIFMAAGMLTAVFVLKCEYLYKSYTAKGAVGVTRNTTDAKTNRTEVFCINKGQPRAPFIDGNDNMVFKQDLNNDLLGEIQLKLRELKPMIHSNDLVK